MDDGAVLGITVRDGEITIHPYTDKRLGYAKGSYLSPMGKILSSWKYEENEIIFTFEIPTNANARIILPDGNEQILKSGNYTYKLPL